jgi:hypothetical protein
MRSDDTNVEELGIPFNTENALIVGKNEDGKAKLMTELIKLEAENLRVIITDRYLFPAKKNNPDYETLIIDILKSLKAKEILYCSDRLQDPALFTRVQKTMKQVGTDLIHYNLADFHDRYWICLEKRKAIVVGTSVNGIGNSVYHVNALDTEDVEQLFKELQSRGVLAKDE